MFNTFNTHFYRSGATLPRDVRNQKLQKFTSTEKPDLTCTPPHSPRRNPGYFPDRIPRNPKIAELWMSSPKFSKIETPIIDSPSAPSPSVVNATKNQDSTPPLTRVTIPRGPPTIIRSATPIIQRPIPRG